MLDHSISGAGGFGLVISQYMRATKPAVSVQELELCSVARNWCTFGSLTVSKWFPEHGAQPYHTVAYPATPYPQTSDVYKESPWLSEKQQRRNACLSLIRRYRTGRLVTSHRHKSIRSK